MIVRIPFGDDSTAAYPELAPGSSGPYVTELQTRLNAAGANIGGNPNGTFDAGTTQAIKNFQAAYGIDQTGNATTATWSKLVEITPSVDGVSVRGLTSGDTVYITPQPKILGMPIPVAIAAGATAAFILALGLAKLAGRGARRHAIAGYRRRRRR